jgi:hypothetical protein
MRTRNFLVIAAVTLCALELSAAPRTFVSAQSGADANPCNRTLPCRSFTAALAVTDLNGEVIVLDSGGYGAATINQGVSLISPQGVHAGITTTGADGIVVNAGDTAHVVLRNLALTLNGQSNSAGIHANTVAALYVEGCTISGYYWGVLFDPTTAGARLYVNDSVIRREYGFMQYGIHVAGIGLNLRAMIDSTQVYDASQAMYFQNAQATIRDCVAVGDSTQYGYEADGQSGVVISRSVARAFSYGYFANQSSVMLLTRSLANLNGIYGASAFDSNIYVSESNFTQNYQAVFGSASGAIRTRGNNTAQQNSNSNGVFTITYAAR